MKKKKTFVVHYIVDIPKVSVSVHPNSTVQEGTDVIFECIHDVKFAPFVIWSKDDKHIPFFRSSLEYIYNITRTDTGLYSCKITKNENEGSGNASLDILCMYNFLRNIITEKN